MTVAFYGVHRDGQALAAIIDKEVFKGTLVSDGAAVYQGFDEAQKCWAHLIRKAIKLTLTSPDDPRFRQLADGLLEIYREGVDGNNNASERELRDDAMARRTGRTSKTPAGAKRRSIISSVLRSIGKQVEVFTLASVIAEVKQWIIRGKSCFEALASKAANQTTPGILDRLVLEADKPAITPSG